MAPRWLSSGQSMWGQASDRGVGALVGVAVFIFILGSVLGYSVRGFADRSPLESPEITPGDDSAVIDPAVAAMGSAGQSADGAVKAATSFLSGFPEIALRSPDDQAEIVAGIVDPGADASVAAGLLARLSAARQELLPNPSARLDAKLITVPVSYKVTTQGDDRATVSIWAVRVYLNAQGAQLSSLWSTNDIGLVYTDKWRLARFNTTPGPNPPLEPGAAPASYGDVAAALRGGSKAYRDALAAED